MNPRFFLSLPALCFWLAAAPAADKTKPGSPVFESHVRPILKAHCFECHGEGKRLKGGLDLRLVRSMAQGGDSGPAVQAGKAGESLILERLKKQEMPPGKKKLTRAEISRIERWIAAGAKTARPEPEKLQAGFHITAQERSFWSFQPIRRPAVPRVKNADRVRTPIDAFLLTKLEEKGLGFSPEADKRTLLRRAYFDLLGLPPSPKDVEQFLADDAPNAYEKLIDRLLAAPQYGERWGRHWLDVAGYADSEGFSGEDPLRPSAFRYRDYVIRSFNADKPLDQFIVEQLAGDELVLPYPASPTPLHPPLPRGGGGVARRTSTS